MDKKPELDDLIKHYGVKGMKWKNVQDKVEETINTSEGITDEVIADLKKKAKKAGKKFKNLDDLIKNFGDKKLKSLTKGGNKVYNFVGNIDHKRRERLRQKEMLKTMNVVMKNNGKIPKGYKQKDIPYSAYEKKQMKKELKAMANAWKKSGMDKATSNLK